jgi:3-oxoacyl-[acyl-carrier protein] reductase
MAPWADAVAIVTGGSSGLGREVALRVSTWGSTVVVVYLEHQRSAEATVAEIVAAGGTTVAVRADLSDELDVERLFTESMAAFGDVDVVVHTTADGDRLLYRHAARHLRRGGAIVSLSPAEPMAAAVAQQLRERDITVGTAAPEAVLSFLDGWRGSRAR